MLYVKMSRVCHDVICRNVMTISHIMVECGEEREEGVRCYTSTGYIGNTIHNR